MKRFAAAAGLLLALLRGGLHAQTLTIRVVTDSGGTPVAGAIVRLLRKDSTVAQGLTEAGGRLTLKAPGPGKYALRAGRIGYLPGAPVPVEVAAGESRAVDLAVTTRRVELPTISVVGERRCGRLSDERALSAVIWNQVRDVLAATQILEARGQEYEWARFERRVTTRHTVTAEQVRPARRGVGRPFVTRAPAELVRAGFIDTQGDSVTYYAPDAELLLYEPFVLTHCFTTIPPPDSLKGHIGLAFEPVDGRQVPEITGVLWVNRATAALAALEYRYVNTRPIVVRSEAGGLVRFGQMPNGGWYITDWAIVMPVLARLRGGLYSEDGLEHDSLVGYRVQGGLARPVGGSAAAAAPLGVTGPPSRLHGRIDDSLRSGGLAGVVVRVAGMPDSAVTDSAGRYALDVPLTGSRFLTFGHPLLERFPDRTSRIVEFRPGVEVEFDTGLPAPASVAARLCDRTGKSGLAGEIVPVPGAGPQELVVTASWVESVRVTGARTEVRRSSASTAVSERGVWVLCDLPEGQVVTVQELRGKTPVARLATRTERGKFLWVSLETLPP